MKKWSTDQVAGTTIKIDRKKVESELSDLRKQRDRVSGTIDLGDTAVSKRLAKEAAESQIEKIRDENKDFSAKFVKARQKLWRKFRRSMTTSHCPMMKRTSCWGHYEKR